MPIWGAQMEMGINAHTRRTTEGKDAYKERFRGRESEEVVL